MAGMLRVPRSRGALSGALLVLLGLWGGLIAFVGPYFHFAYTPGTAWTYTSGRLWLEILPGIATALGGLILLASRVRPVAMFGAWLAALGGAWFAVGRVLSPVWNAHGTVALGTPIGGTLTRALVELSYFTGLGVIIVFLAALSLGRLTVVGVRDARLSERAAEEDAAVTEPAVTSRHGHADPVVYERPPASVRYGASGGRADRGRAADGGRSRPASRPPPGPGQPGEPARRHRQPGKAATQPGPGQPAAGPGPRDCLAARARPRFSPCRPAQPLAAGREGISMTAGAGMRTTRRSFSLEK